MVFLRGSGSWCTLSTMKAKGLMDCENIRLAILAIGLPPDLPCPANQGLAPTSAQWE